MYPGAQAKIRPQAAGSLISCASGLRRLDRYALHREQRPLCRILRRRVRGALLNLHQLVPDAGKPRLGPMSSAVLRRVPNRVRRRLFAGGGWIRTSGSAMRYHRRQRDPRRGARQCDPGFVAHPQQSCVDLGRDRDASGRYQRLGTDSSLPPDYQGFRAASELGRSILAAGQPSSCRPPTIGVVRGHSRSHR